MKKELSVYHLIVTAVFIGILLTFSIFYITNILVEGEDSVAPQCYDGTVIEGNGPLTRFSRAVYQSKSSLSFIHQSQYRLFGMVNSTLVIAGSDDFLFEIEDSEHGYHYLDDYMGNCTFTEEESAQILAELERRRASYAERDAEYLLVIIPNAQTVYSECMPMYLGEISDTTRLSALSSYLTEHDFYHFVNLTEELRAAKSDGLLYNNTENSLNSLGLYYTYRAIYERFSPTVLEHTDMIERENLHFYQHMTSGKSIARKAGLSDVVENRTVSLSNTTKLNYRFLSNTGASATTILLPFYISSDASASPELLLQFSNTWERLQIEPFFSNTFGKVTYQTDLTDDPAIFAAAQPRVVIQFMYEYELSDLLK
ncbi:MAG: hypothetical protein IJX39_06615 [Clostridia bacterium]|nr:hypothetical protein [Clostridia bacterium]